MTQNFPSSAALTPAPNAASLYYPARLLVLAHIGFEVAYLQQFPPQRPCVALLLFAVVVKVLCANNRIISLVFGSKLPNSRLYCITEYQSQVQPDQAAGNFDATPRIFNRPIHSGRLERKSPMAMFLILRANE